MPHVVAVVLALVHTNLRCCSDHCVLAHSRLEVDDAMEGEGVLRVVAQVHATVLHQDEPTSSSVSIQQRAICIILSQSSFQRTPLNDQQ